MPDEPLSPESDQPNAPPVVAEGVPSDHLEADAVEVRRRRSENRILAVTAWGLVALLFLVLIIGAVMGAYEREGGSELDFSLAEKELQLNVEQVELFRRWSLPSVGQGSLPDNRNVLDHSTDDVWAARILAVVSFENGEEVPEAVLELLAGSDNESDQAIAVLYGQGELDQQQADAIEADANAAYSYRLATVHARESLGDEDARARLLDTRMFVSMMAGFLVAVMLAFLGLVVIVVYFIRRSSGSTLPVGYPRILGGVPGADRSALRFGLCFVAFFMLAIVAELKKLGVTEAAISVLSGVLILVAILAIIAMPAGGVSDSLKRVFGRSAQWRQLVGAGALAYLAFTPVFGVAILLSAWLTRFFPVPSHPISERLPSAGPMELVLLFTTAIVLAPITEELMFRGLLFPALAERLKSPWAGMLVSGFLFAAIHPQGPSGWPPLIAVGFMAALVTYQTGSLLPAMVLHSLHNIFAVTIGRLIG